MGRGTPAVGRTRPGIGDVEALLRQALDDSRAGRAERAEATLRRILAERPGEHRAAELLAVMCTERGDADEAVALLEAAAEHVGPPSRATVPFHNNRANALRRAGRLGEAEHLLRELVTIAPDEWQPWHNLGQVLRDEGRHDEALAALRRATALEPGYGANHAVVGELLHKLGRFNSARAALHRGIELGCAGDPNVWTLLGNTYRQLGRLDEAIEHLRHVVEMSGGSSYARSNLGVTLAQAGRLEESLAEFEQALAQSPDDDAVRHNAAYAHLTAGRLDTGWALWEHGIHGGPRGRERLPEGVRRWTPDDQGTRVLVYREQGVGDEIMFASVYGDLIATAPAVIIECDRRLTGLFTRSFPDATVRPFSYDPARGGETIVPPDFDRAVPAGTLPEQFRPDVSSFPDRRSYLVPDPERVERWRERLSDRARPIVGISWRSIVKTAERRLEYTQLREWGEILTIPGVTWVNLQYDDCERELREAERRFGVEILRWPWLDLMNDFEEVAALTSCLDHVVAPRNAVAMLSGALGVPTTMMGNAWDWSDLGTGRSPWFPSVELAVREHRNDWDGVLAQAARRVAALASATGR
jgi:Flp pilus assembly protein TadD